MEEKKLSAGDSPEAWGDPLQQRIITMYNEYRAQRDVSDIPDGETAIAYIACGFARHVLEHRNELP